MLKWIYERAAGVTGNAEETPIGFVPSEKALDLGSLKLDPADVKNLLSIDTGEWKDEIPGIREHYKRFGDRLPAELNRELEALEKRLSKS